MRATLELLRRRKEGGIRYATVQDQQLPVVRSSKRGNLVLGGNRSGKTVVGGLETTWRLLGDHPFKAVPPAPIKVWAASQDLPGTTDSPHKQLEELRRWLPKDALRGGSWETAYAPAARVLTLANGSVVIFKGYDQGLLKFESDAIHWAWMDEEPPDKRIWTSTLLRLADFSGQWMITATPVLSLQGKGWLEELWDKRADADCSYDTFQLFPTANPHLSRAVLEELLGNLTEEERLVRATGAFARLGGRVLSEFDPLRHLVDDFLPPATWRHYLVIDPGWHKAGHLFAAVDPDGRIWLYAEHYAGELRPEQHAAILHAMWMGFGQPEITVLMDPAGLSIKRTTTGRESPSDAHELKAAAAALGAEWLTTIRAANNADTYAWRVKRYLAADLLKVCRGLRWWRWEQERWTREREREGVAAAEKAVPDKPVDRNNHLMDPTRYLCNELPDPLPLPEDDTHSAIAEHWKRKLEGRDAPKDDV